jgi:hypothetical protein
MKTSKFLSVAFLAFLLLLLPASGNASTISYSEFRLWNLQVSSSTAANGAGMDFDLFSGTVSVYDSINGKTSLQPKTVSSANRYTYEKPEIPPEYKYTSAEPFIEPIAGIDMGSIANVNIPFTSDSLFKGEADGLSVLTENAYVMDFQNADVQEETLTISFDYQSILNGFSSDEFGFFDSSLSVNITLLNWDTNEIITLFSLNDEILGRNQDMTQDSGIQHFEKELTILMTDAAFYQLGISIETNAYASTQGTQGTPEPSAILLLSAGLIVAVFISRRKES